MTDAPLIAGRHLLDGIAPTRVVVLVHKPTNRLLRIIEASLPAAQVLHVGTDIPSDATGAFAAARQVEWGAVVVAQRQRNLEALALAMRADRRVLLRAGCLEPLGAGDLVIQQALRTPMVGALLQRTSKRVARRIETLRHAASRPLGIGLDNDFSSLATDVARLPMGWPRLKVSVVVPVYNRREILAKTIAALRHQTYPAELFEIIIADDGSNDHPETLIDRHRGHLDIRVVAQEDLGFRAARVRNLGIQATTGEVIVLLDCDMLPAPDLLRAHLKWFHVTKLPLVTIGMRKFVLTDHLSDQDVLANIDCVSELEERLAPLAIRDPERPTIDWRLKHYEQTHDLRKDTLGYRFGASGNLAFWRHDAIEAGLFDESYERWGGEDIEFAYRLRRRGALFISEQDALAYHQEHPDAVVREEDALTTREMTRSKIPVRREETPGEAFEVPKVAIVIASSTPSAETLASAENQVGVSTEVCMAPSLAEAIAKSRAEYVLELGADDRLYPEAAAQMSYFLEREPLTTLVCGAFELPDGRARRGTPVVRPRMYRVSDYHRLLYLQPGVANDPAPALASLGRARHSSRVVYRYVENSELSRYATIHSAPLVTSRGSILSPLRRAFERRKR